MKLLSIPLAILGIALVIFAIMAHLELRRAATSATNPDPATMPLTKLVGPELFAEPAEGTVPPKPAELARTISNKIYAIAGIGLLLIGGAVVLAIQSPKKAQLE